MRGKTRRIEHHFVLFLLAAGGDDLRDARDRQERRRVEDENDAEARYLRTLDMLGLGRPASTNAVRRP